MNTFRRTVLALALTGTLGATAAGVALTGNGLAAASSPNKPVQLTGQERTLIRQHTRQFRDVDAAVAAGYIPTHECVAHPELGGMGYHYVHPQYVGDDVIDVTKPEVLVYHDGPNGELRLGAVEWLRFDADQDLSTDDDRPFLFDKYAFEGPMEGHEPGMPRHFDLHLWLYRHNPAGELTGFNPAVSCPD